MWSTKNRNDFEQPLLLTALSVDIYGVFMIVISAVVQHAIGGSKPQSHYSGVKENDKRMLQDTAHPYAITVLSKSCRHERHGAS